MQNFVTFETAKKLKKAGFTQPEVDFGQIWYDPYSQANAAYRITGGRVWFCGNDDGAVSYAPVAAFQNTMIFAPTATDILRELGQAYWLSYDKFYFWCMNKQVAEIPTEHSLNPAEACAAAWLSVHQPKQERVVISGSDTQSTTYKVEQKLKQ